MFMIEIALTFMVSATVLVLLYTDGFKNRKASILAGVILGLGLLTKQKYIVFVVGPIAWIFLSSYLSANNKARRLAIINLLIFSAIGVFIALPWYLFDFFERLEFIKSCAFNQLFVPEEMSVSSIRSFFYYLSELKNWQIFPFFFFILIVSLIIAVRDKKRIYLFLVWIIVPYSILTLFPNKFFYYTLPYLPAVAYICSNSILGLGNIKIRRMAVVLVLFIGLYQFFNFSYFRTELHSKILATSKYAPRQGDYTDELLADINKNSKGEKLLIGFYGIEANEVSKKNLELQDNYCLVNAEWLKLYFRLKGIKHELFNLKFKPAKVNFIITFKRLEYIDMKYFPKNDYVLQNIFVMADSSFIYLYKLITLPQDTLQVQPQKKQEDATQLSDGNIKLKLEDNTWKIFWQDKEITKNLSIYTSFFLGSNWCDSEQSQWETVKLNEKAIMAIERSRCAPVFQIWYFKLDGNRIYWNVEMQVKKNIRLSREQANVMLSESYAKWLSPQAGGLFPSGFNVDYGGDWQTLQAFKVLPNSYVGALGDGNLLPSVYFYCTYPRKNMVGNVINSDDLFSGRVLQYVVKHNRSQSIPPGRYEYFQGYFLIQE